MNTKLVENYKKNLELTKYQRQIIIGLLLGDGHLETQNNARTYRLKVEHSIKQRDYTEWLYDVFQDFVPGGVYLKNRKNGKDSVGFTTYSHGKFRFYARQFYKNGKKVIPQLIKKLLSPIGLAIWYLDDGSLKSVKHKTYILHTLGFTKEDLLIIKKTLLEKFDICVDLHKQKNNWRLYILSKSAQKFESIVSPYVSKFTSMQHKLSNKMPKK